MKCLKISQNSRNRHKDKCLINHRVKMRQIFHMSKLISTIIMSRTVVVALGKWSKVNSFIHRKTWKRLIISIDFQLSLWTRNILLNKMKKSWIIHNKKIHNKKLPNHSKINKSMFHWKECQRSKHSKLTTHLMNKNNK